MRSEKARAKAQNIVAIIADIERSGVTSLNGIAKALTARGVQTPRRMRVWYPVQVLQVKAMAAA